MICFQFLNYLSSSTTFGVSSGVKAELWFAFNFWTTLVLRQRNIAISSSGAVVICFQFLNYLSSSTTIFQTAKITAMLWFAFNFWTTLVLRQRCSAVWRWSVVVICFQFLNYLSSSTTVLDVDNLFSVVICFQFLNYLSSSTTGTWRG